MAWILKQGVWLPRNQMTIMGSFAYPAKNDFAKDDKIVNAAIDPCLNICMNSDLKMWQ